MTHCLWNDDENVHKYHLAGWKHVFMRKEYGGLGVPDLRELNLCLLGSLIKRYAADKDKIWKLLIDFKYNTNNPNVLCCRDNGASNFWKGVRWAAKAARMGYRWKVGNWVKIRFWEDLWLDSSSLAIQYWELLGSSSLVTQYWELYCLVNEHNSSIAELWDGENLKCTFRRCVDVRLMNMWYEVVNIASTLELSQDEDELIWQFHSSGVYSSQSLYVVINFRGVSLVFVPAVWSLKVPPRVHFFLWLLSKNKLLTRDNLEKR
jgi:hypothetical protein